MPYRDAIVGFKVTLEEAQKIEEMARIGGFLSKSDFLRFVVLTDGASHSEDVVRIIRSFNNEIINLRQEVQQLKMENINLKYKKD